MTAAAAVVCWSIWRRPVILLLLWMVVRCFATFYTHTHAPRLRAVRIHPIRYRLCLRRRVPGCKMAHWLGTVSHCEASTVNTDSGRASFGPRDAAAGHGRSALLAQSQSGLTRTFTRIYWISYSYTYIYIYNNNNIHEYIICAYNTAVYPLSSAIRCCMYHAVCCILPHLHLLFLGWTRYYYIYYYIWNIRIFNDIFIMIYNYLNNNYIKNTYRHTDAHRLRLTLGLSRLLSAP